jgi:hypothetical protein
MRPRVYKLNQKKLADEVKINLVFIPLDRYYSDMAMGGQFGRETYVDVASLPDSVILRFTEFIVQKSEDGRPISRDFSGTFYQKLDNVVLTQDEETGHLELISSGLEDITGSFDEITIPQDQKPEEEEEEADNTELEAEDAEEEETPNAFKDAIDEALNSEEDIHTMDVPDDAEEEPSDEEDEESFEEEDADPDEYDGPESGVETHDPSVDEAMDESEEEDDDIDVFSQDYFEEDKKAKEKTEENRKELAKQINEQQSKLVSANKRQLPKPNHRLVPREDVQKPNRDNNQQQRRQNNNNRPPQNGKKKFQPNRDNNRDVKIVKAPGIFDDPLRAELFNKLKED